MPGRREEARAATLADIRAVARRQLASDGPAALSLRSVARELGMVSSGIYRYVASRDELLTMLVVAAYNDLADEIEGAVAGRGDAAARWLRGCRAVRAFALARPHEYALLYGTPVIGYAAPQDTIGPATRVYAALASPLAGASASLTVPPSLRDDAEAIADGLGLADRATGLRFLTAVGQIFGTVSLELFGHMNNVIGDRATFFDWTAKSILNDFAL